MSHTIFEWIGAAITALLVFAIAFTALAVFVHICKKIYDASVDIQSRKNIRYFGIHMKGQHHWFQGELSTMWQEIADQFIQGNMPDASQIRKKIEDSQ